MSFPFDATLKELVRRYPIDWLSGLGLDTEGPVLRRQADSPTMNGRRVAPRVLSFVTRW